MVHGLRRLLPLCLLMVATSSVALAQAPQAVLRPGDALRVTVWRNAEFSGEFAVLSDGSLGHPLMREVRVANQPMATVEQGLRTFLTRYEAEPRFVIEPLFRIVVGGEVRQPGVFTLPPSATLAEAVAQAGGGTDRAKLREVRLQRDGQIMMIDLTDPSPSGLAHSAVRSGDQLFVERRTSVFRDYIAPAGSIVAAMAAIANILLR